MLVEELIAQLQKCDPKIPVKFPFGGREPEVTEVHEETDPDSRERYVICY
jgi:hypothetical protein